MVFQQKSKIMRYTLYDTILTQSRHECHKSQSHDMTLDLQDRSEILTEICKLHRATVILIPYAFLLIWHRIQGSARFLTVHADDIPDCSVEWEPGLSQMCSFLCVERVFCHAKSHTTTTPSVDKSSDKMGRRRRYIRDVNMPFSDVILFPIR